VKNRHRGVSKSERDTLHCVSTPECGKRGYHSRSDAKKALRGHRGAGFSRGVRPYECPTCGYWHLGHVPFSVRAGAISEQEFFGR
jgi:ssDNA-binding Zn-finger/Zn-ribbon topoisomerase 1